MKTYVKRLIPVSILFFAAGCGENTDTENDNIENSEVDENIEENNEPNNSDAQAEMIDENEESLGTVYFYEESDHVRVEAELTNLQSGAIQGFHIHEEAVCDVDEDEVFSSAGGHYNPEDVDHGEHVGDLPALFTKEDGSASMAVQLDRFSVDQLLEDEVAVIIHEDPDNLANIPDRYQSEDSNEAGPDEDTLDTGDAGDRYGCGVVEAS